MDKLYGYVSYISIKLFLKKAGEFEFKECSTIKFNNQPMDESVWKQVLSTRWQDVTYADAKGNVPLSVVMIYANSLWPSDSHLGGNPLELLSKEQKGVHSSTVCRN